MPGPAGELSALPIPLAEFKGPSSKGRQGKDREGGRGKGKEGRRRKGWRRV